MPCSTSIVAFHTGELVLERLGSLDAEMIAKVAARHGLTLRIAGARSASRSAPTAGR